MVNLVDSWGNPEIHDGGGHFENKTKFVCHMTV